MLQNGCNTILIKAQYRTFLHELVLNEEFYSIKAYYIAECLQWNYKMPNLTIKTKYIA